ncbi:MAG: MBL fold metallo-hydrolase [Planctomycetota bacterium]
MPFRLTVPLVFLGLAVGGSYVELGAAPSPAAPAIMALRSAQPPAQGGTLPAQWDAGNDCATELDYQVHAYNEDFYVIRQSKCINFEAPFLYLIFGDRAALLMDTGASPGAPVYDTVMRVIAARAQAKGEPAPPLVVAHSHGHGDHVAGDGQFIGQPGVAAVIGTSLAQVRDFWGFQSWPHDVPTFDLGGRILDVIATPGHATGSVTLYDRRTQLLLTGDIVYPGHLFVFSPAAWGRFEASLERLVTFARQNPVRWVLGCHIETSNTPFAPYRWGRAQHPDERRLEFAPSKLSDIYRAALSMGGAPECTIFEDFVIHPVYLCGITWNG